MNGPQSLQTQKEKEELMQVILETQNLVQNIEKDLQEIQTKLSILKTQSTSVAQTPNTLPRENKVCKSCKQKEGTVCCSMCKKFICQTCIVWDRSKKSTSFLPHCEICSFFLNKHLYLMHALKTT